MKPPTKTIPDQMTPKSKQFIGRRIREGVAAAQHDKIYWRDVTPQMTVTDDGTTWKAGGLVIYWHGHEATAALRFLNARLSENRRLMEALKKLVYWLETPETAERSGIKWRDALDEARQALAQADKEGV